MNDMELKITTRGDITISYSQRSSIVIIENASIIDILEQFDERTIVNHFGEAILMQFSENELLRRVEEINR